jgi:hypothetical protein
MNSENAARSALKQLATLGTVTMLLRNDGGQGYGLCLTALGKHLGVDIPPAQRADSDLRKKYPNLHHMVMGGFGENTLCSAVLPTLKLLAEKYGDTDIPLPSGRGHMGRATKENFATASVRTRWRGKKIKEAKVRAYHDEMLALNQAALREAYGDTVTLYRALTEVTETLHTLGLVSGPKAWKEARAWEARLGAGTETLPDPLQGQLTAWYLSAWSVLKQASIDVAYEHGYAGGEDETFVLVTAEVPVEDIPVSYLVGNMSSEDRNDIGFGRLDMFECLVRSKDGKIPVSFEIIRYADAPESDVPGW